MALFVVFFVFVLVLSFEDFTTGDAICHGVLPPSGGRSISSPSTPASLRRCCHVVSGWVHILIFTVPFFPSHPNKFQKTYQTSKNQVTLLQLKLTSWELLVCLHLRLLLLEDGRVFVAKTQTISTTAEFLLLLRSKFTVGKKISEPSSVSRNFSEMLMKPSGSGHFKHLPRTILHCFLVASARDNFISVSLTSLNPEIAFNWLTGTLPFLLSEIELSMRSLCCWSCDDFVEFLYTAAEEKKMQFASLNLIWNMGCRPCCSKLRSPMKSSLGLCFWVLSYLGFRPLKNSFGINVLIITFMLLNFGSRSLMLLLMM